MWIATFTFSDALPDEIRSGLPTIEEIEARHTATGPDGGYRFRYAVSRGATRMT